MAAESQFANFLFPESVVREDGAGTAIQLGEAQGKTLEVTLVINRIIEQESLDVSLWASPDGANWGAKPVAAFPQKFYCGTYSACVDLSSQPEAKFLRVQWKMNRWGRGEPKPLFGFYVFAEAPAAALAARG